MGLVEMSGVLEMTAMAKVVLVLDASESAQKHWAEIASIVRRVVDRLPASVKCSLYFLGNPSCYEPSQFAMQSVHWYAENKRRASLITPVFEALTKESEITTIVIIGSGRIFDLDDWIGNPLLERTTLVSIGESLQGDLKVAKEIASASAASLSADEICRHLHDPITAVEISGTGFMPIWWSNIGYRLSMVNGRASLRAERLSNFSIAMRFFIDSTAQALARLSHESGKESWAKISQVEAIPEAEPQVIELTKEEQEIFRKAIAKEQFTCLHCHKQHSWSTLYCLESSAILGELVYPSLSQQGASGFVIFCEHEGRIGFIRHACDVIPLSKTSVVIREGRRAQIYKYDENGQCWVSTGQSLEPYFKVGESTYAIVI